MPRKVSHGWSFRQQGGSHPSKTPKSGSLREKPLPSTFAVKKRIFLQKEQIEFLLERFEHLEDLVNGKVAPKNKAGENFIKVAKGKLKPSTKYENAYLYMKQYKISFSQLKEKLKEIELADINKEHKSTAYVTNTKNSNLSLSQRAKIGSLRAPHPIEEKNKKRKSVSKIDYSQIPGAGLASKSKKYVRKVSEPLGTREDYKRDRATWKRGGA